MMIGIGIDSPAISSLVDVPFDRCFRATPAIDESINFHSTRITRKPSAAVRMRFAVQLLQLTLISSRLQHVIPLSYITEKAFVTSSHVSARKVIYMKLAESSRAKRSVKPSRAIELISNFHSTLLLLLDST